MAPHAAIDVRAIGCDFLVCSAYKYFGPHLGVLYGREELLQEIEAYKVRCVSNDLPGRFEMGTPQTELLAGLVTSGRLSGVDWRGQRRRRLPSCQDRRRLRRLTQYERQLSDRLIDGLRGLPGVTIHGIVNSNRFSERVPTVSFTHRQRGPEHVAKSLAADGVCARSGHNYAYEVVRHLNIDEAAGVVRIGMAHYNTLGEVDRTLAAVRRSLA